MIGSVAVDHIIEKEMFFSRTGIRKISNTVAAFGSAMALLSRAVRRAAWLKKIESKKCAYEVCLNK